MPSNTFAYRAAIGLIWALALWHSWICRGLFVDGFAFLVQVAAYEWFFYFYPPRIYAMVAGQIPVMTAVILGVTDLHLLARLLSLGFFGLPTIFYTGALFRARNDPVLLALVIAIIAIVFLPVSFFIVGEYNTLYAFATFVGITLLTSDRLRWGEGLMLAVLGAFSIRIYEAMVYVGPLLVVMTLWHVWKHARSGSGGAPSLISASLYLLAAAFFAAGAWVARDSIVHPFSELSALHLEDTLQQARNFWHNMQFDFVFGPALVIVVWALVRPADLATAKPYRWAALGLGVLVLTPLLAFGDTLIRPLAKSQYVSRVMGGMVVCATVMFAWFYCSHLHVRLKATVVLHQPPAARRFLAFACLMPLAVLPSDIFLSQSWVKFVEDTREAVARGGIIPFEETKLSQWPDILLVENWVLSTQCLAVRSSDADGIVLPPKGYSEWVPFNPEEPPNMGRFYWRR
jgi:hypothetical protein